MTVNDHATAIDVLETLLEIDAANEQGYKADALADIAFCYFQTKNNDQALNYYTKYLDGFATHSRHDEVLYYNGFIYWTMGDADSANMLFEELGQSYPKSAYTRNLKRVMASMRQQNQNN